jgi:hypothetical protein
MSRKLLVLLALVAAGPAYRCAAQEAPLSLRRDHAATPSNEISAGSVTPTPDMWYYQQELKRYADPKLAIRRRAEQRADQRRERLASREWYGVSNTRPMVSTSPQYMPYSTFWGSNTYDVLRWRASPPSMIIAR